MNSTDDKRSGRAVTACSECQRRKQKCNRIWPCNHCQTRKSAHLCQFRKVTSNPNTSGLSGGENETKTRTQKKRKHHGMENSPSEYEPRMHDVEQPDVGNALNALGYVESDMFREFNNTITTPIENKPSQLPDEIIKALRTIPPRPYTDDLVQNFFENVNYHYNILHQTSFLSTYSEWWSQKRQLQSPGVSTIAFSCLVLRICANSTQFLPPTLLEKLESDLGESEGLSSHYQTSAQILSNFLSPGEGGLMQVQQLFLEATWLKAEAEFVKSWHSVSAAVRVGQEIGMHKNDTSQGISDFEREMRKRVWCGLYTWDRFMSALFNRPSIILDISPISLPNPRLDQSATNAKIPSPIVAKILECQLATQLSVLVAGQSDLQTMLASVETWMASLPSSFSIHQSDTRWDLDHPRIVFQRSQLHCAGYMTLLMLLKSTLAPPLPTIQANQDEEDAERSRLVSYAIETSLNIMSACKDFFIVSYPDKVKYFMVAFCPFDTASLLCSVLMNDKEHAIPKRLEVIEAVGTALYMSSRLRLLTKMGQATWGILAKLISHLELPLVEKQILNKAGNGGHFTGNAKLTHTSINNETNLLGSNSTPSISRTEASGSHEALLEGEIWSDSFMVQDFTPDIDLGVLDGVWDWESTLFDPFRTS